MRLFVCALLVAIGLLPAFTLGLWLGFHTKPPAPDCAPYPVSAPLEPGGTGMAL